MNLKKKKKRYAKKKKNCVIFQSNTTKKIYISSCQFHCIFFRRLVLLLRWIYFFEKSNEVSISTISIGSTELNSWKKIRIFFIFLKNYTQWHYLILFRLHITLNLYHTSFIIILFIQLNTTKHNSTLYVFQKVLLFF